MSEIENFKPNIDEAINKTLGILFDDDFDFNCPIFDAVMNIYVELAELKDLPKYIYQLREPTCSHVTINDVFLKHSKCEICDKYIFNYDIRRDFEFYYNNYLKRDKKYEKI